MFRLRRINFSIKLFFLLHIYRLYSVEKYNFSCLQREFDPPTNTFFHHRDSEVYLLKTLLNSAFSWCERRSGVCDFVAAESLRSEGILPCGRSHYGEKFERRSVDGTRRNVLSFMSCNASCWKMCGHIQTSKDSSEIHTGKSLSKL